MTAGDGARGFAAFDPERLATLQAHGLEVRALSPLGFAVRGARLREGLPEPVRLAVEREMADHGFVVFEEQGVLSGDEQVRASRLWGARELHSTHGVHPEAPNRHIFRLSNDENVGILGVGPQWHNDGSFEHAVFSHVCYHIVRVPEGGGGTFFAHQGAAFDALTVAEQERWQRLVSVNSNSGVLHPVAHTHPVSGRKSVYLHLGMTGAVLEVLPEEDREEGKPPLRLLDQKEMMALFHRYNDLLNGGLTAAEPFTIDYQYRPGDCIFIDNLAVAHRAAPEAHEGAGQRGLRILHRTTIAAPGPFEPPFGLPPVLNIHGPNPLGRSDAGVWQGGGLGFVWDPSKRLQN